MENRPAIRRKVEIQLYDFAALVQAPLPVDGIKIRYLKAGDLRSNGRTIQPKNCLMFEREYPDDAKFDDMIDDMLQQMGGAAAVASMIERVRPASAFLRLHVPVKSSQWTQDDGIGIATLTQLLEAGLALDFWFT